MKCWLICFQDVLSSFPLLSPVSDSPFPKCPELPLIPFLVALNVSSRYSDLVYYFNWFYSVCTVLFSCYFHIIKSMGFFI